MLNETTIKGPYSFRQNIATLLPAALVMPTWKGMYARLQHGLQLFLGWRKAFVGTQFT